MNQHKILKAMVAVVMAAVLVVLIMLTVNHVKAGLLTSNSKLMLAAYIAMILYASYRIFVNIREIFRG
ncbi:MAG: hypothetical protein IKB85_03215 [Bacteroidales bacterium]|nr:hypothetical protein [Bacteroidales bacterium]